jgi:hypothetical protein
MAAARGKNRRASSPAKKKNGHGGKREGAGRKQEKLPETLLKELGNPPEDPLEKRQWWNRLLEVLQYGVLQGRPWLTMLREARANALAAAKLVPEEIKARAAQILEQEDRETEADASPRVTKLKEDRLESANAVSLRRDPS